MGLLSRHLLCQRQKPTSIYMKKRAAHLDLQMTFRLLKPLTAERYGARTYSGYQNIVNEGCQDKDVICCAEITSETCLSFSFDAFNLSPLQFCDLVSLQTAVA